MGRLPTSKLTTNEIAITTKRKIADSSIKVPSTSAYNTPTMIVIGKPKTKSDTRSHWGNEVLKGHAMIASAPCHNLLHRDSVSACSSLYASGARPLSEASIGIKVIATTSEISIANVTVSD